jgi:hypothetical protein
LIGSQVRQAGGERGGVRQAVQVVLRRQPDHRRSGGNQRQAFEHGFHRLDLEAGAEAHRVHHDINLVVECVDVVDAAQRGEGGDIGAQAITDGAGHQQAGAGDAALIDHRLVEGAERVAVDRVAAGQVADHRIGGGAYGAAAPGVQMAEHAHVRVAHDCELGGFFLLDCQDDVGAG